jgi:NADH-quinone oxidoreductase subunit E
MAETKENANPSPPSPAVEPHLTAELKEFIALWRDKPGNLIMVLHRIQEHYGYIPLSVAMETAEALATPLAKVYGVVTFYHLFRLTRPGRHRIAVCMGTACYLKGAEELIREVESLLGIGVNGITPDAKFSLEIVRCVGCCGLAPVMMVDKDVHGKVTPEEIAGILAKYKE